VVRGFVCFGGGGGKEETERFLAEHRTRSQSQEACSGKTSGVGGKETIMRDAYVIPSEFA